MMIKSCGAGVTVYDKLQHLLAKMIVPEPCQALMELSEAELLQEG